VVTYKTVLQVNNTNLILRPGMTARAVIQVNRLQNVLLVPNAALRFTPPQAPKTEEKKNGSIVSSILPHPPRETKRSEDNGNSKAREQRVWIVRNNQLVPISITRGLTDGVLTEVVKGELEPGMELVTDIETGN